MPCDRKIALTKCSTRAFSARACWSMNFVVRRRMTKRDIVVVPSASVPRNDHGSRDIKIGKVVDGSDRTRIEAIGDGQMCVLVRLDRRSEALQPGSVDVCRSYSADAERIEKPEPQLDTLAIPMLVVEHGIGAVRCATTLVPAGATLACCGW